MTRSQRIALMRHLSQRRVAYRLSMIGDVWSRPETVGAVMDRFRRRPKWAKMSAAGYVQDWIGEALGEEPSPIIFLTPVSAPMPAFIPELLHVIRSRKDWSADAGMLSTEAAGLRYAKLYYGILNNVMDVETAEREVRRLIEADHSATARAIDLAPQIMTLREATRAATPANFPLGHINHLTPRSFDR